MTLQMFTGEIDSLTPLYGRVILKLSKDGMKNASAVSYHDAASHESLTTMLKLEGAALCLEDLNRSKSDYER